MQKIIKYNLEIMTVLLTALCVFGLFFWNDLSLTRKAAMGFIVLLILHEWEESRFPGGFYRIFFSKCEIDETVSEDRMHFPVMVYLMIILPLPFIFDHVTPLLVVLVVLALFEGFIHVAGIWIHQLEKPYSPGMITALLMFVYAITVIKSIGGFAPSVWLWGIVLFLVSFIIMEKNFLKTVGITMTEFRNSMKAYMLNRLRNRK